MSFPRHVPSTSIDMQIDVDEGYDDIESLPDENTALTTPQTTPTLIRRLSSGNTKNEISKLDFSTLVIDSRNIGHTHFDVTIGLIHFRICHYQFLCRTNSADRHQYNVELNKLINLAKAQYIKPAKKQLDLQACTYAVELLRNPKRGNYDSTLPRTKELLIKLAQDNPSRVLLNEVCNNRILVASSNSLSTQAPEKSPPSSSSARTLQTPESKSVCTLNVEATSTIFLNAFQAALSYQMPTKLIYDLCLLLAENFLDPNNSTIGISCTDQETVTRLKQCAQPFNQFAKQLKLGTTKTHTAIKQELLGLISQSHHAIHEIDPDHSSLRFAQQARYLIKKPNNPFILIALRLGMIELHAAEEALKKIPENKSFSEKNVVSNNLPIEIANCSNTQTLYQHHNEILLNTLREEKHSALANNLTLHGPTLYQTANVLLACARNIIDYIESKNKSAFFLSKEDNLPLLQRAAYYYNRVDMISQHLNFDVDIHRRFSHLEVLLKIYQLDVCNETDNLMIMINHAKQHNLANYPEATIKEKAMLAVCSAIYAASEDNLPTHLPRNFTTG